MRSQKFTQAALILIPTLTLTARSELRLARAHTGEGLHGARSDFDAGFLPLYQRHRRGQRCTQWRRGLDPAFGLQVVKVEPKSGLLLLAVILRSWQEGRGLEGGGWGQGRTAMHAVQYVL